MDGTQEIGLAVLATTLSIVAVFLPIGFMGGIIGKFFHEFGVTIVAAVLISMFVSFTLDPMLSSVWHDPAIEAHGKPKANPSFYDRTIGRVTGWFDQRPMRFRPPTRASCAGRWGTGSPRWRMAVGVFATSVVMVPLLGTEFVPKADYSETSLNFYTPVGSSLEATEAKARQVEGIVREFPEVRYTLATLNTGRRRARSTHRSTSGWWTAPTRSRSVDDMAGVLRERLQQVPGITVTHVGLLDAVGGNKQVEFSLLGPDLKELERLAQLVTEQHPHRARPGRPGLQHQARQAGDRRRRQARRRLRPGPVGGADRRRRCARWWRARPWATGARPTTRPTTSTCAWRPTRATRRRTWSACRSPWAATPTAARASCG